MVSSMYSKEDLEETEVATIDWLSVRRSEVVNQQMSRVHSLVVGPGLGRDELAIKIAARVIRAAISRKMSLLIDADGLWLLSQNLSILKGYIH